MGRSRIGDKAAASKKSAFFEFIQPSFSVGVEHSNSGHVDRSRSISRRGDAMRKSLTALATAATIAVAAVAAPTAADARRGWWGPAIGGFAAAAIIGSAFARPYGYYGGYYNYYRPAPVYYNYYQPAPVYYDYYAAPQPYYYNCWRWRYGYRYRVC